jgi:outer membrane protein assembly factor BamA
MTRHLGTVRVALLLIFPLSLGAQKKPPSQAIRFQGAPQYTQQELLAAAGLKPDMHLSSGEVKAHAKQLSDTGLFSVVKFTSDRRTLLFTLTPSSQLFPMHLENIPLTPGKELSTTLHERFPLYRDLLPAGGSMVEGICRTFEEMMAARGVKATVKAALTSGLGPQKLTAVNFTITSPAVRVGHIQLVGISPAMQTKATLIASGQTGNSFDTENTALGLRHVFEDFYQDQGYAAVQVDVAQVDSLIVSDQSVEIPYTITIKEGGIYKLGSIDFPASSLVARAEVEKIVSRYPRGSGRPLDLFLLAVRDAYHAHGYLDCAITPRPSFNEAARIVNYNLEITPGSQYRLTSVSFDGAPDAIVARLRLAWKMAPGAPFDESYLSGFVTLAQKKDKVLAKWMQTVITTNDFKADPATHEVKCNFHFAQAAQSPS